VAFSPSLLIPLSIAALTFVLALDDASYSLPSRGTLAILTWWAVIVGVALRTLTIEGVSKASLVVGGIITALCVWTFASVFWAPSSENAFTEFNRVSLFLGLFVITTLAARRTSFSSWADGLALGISLVAVIALSSRFFWGTFSDQGLGDFLTSVAKRLSYPLGYWNGLAIFVALCVPLLLGIAVESERAIVRGLAVVPLPAIASVVFLASSRGGVATAVVGILVFLLLSERRWAATGALLCGALGSAAALALLNSYQELVNGPFGTSLVKREGRDAALLVTLFCLLSGAIFAAGREVVSRLAKKRSIQPEPWLNRTIIVVLIGACLIGIVASHPVRQFQAFKRPPAIIPTGDFAKEHLLSTNGSGRWQFWTASIKQWESHPLVGGGAGSYEEWWTKHMPASFTLHAKDAHSLYIESLGELGIPGFILTLSLALAGIGVGVCRARRSSGRRRTTLAALAALFAAYAVAAGIDWMWELTVVTMVAIVALALFCSAAGTDPGSPQLVKPSEKRGPRRIRFGLGVAALVTAWLLICAQAIPLLAQLRIKDSQTYAENGNTAAAYRAAMDARNLQPWATSPYFQLELICKMEGRIERAHVWIKRAIAHDPTDWQLWYAASDLEVRLGQIQQAMKSRDRAFSLNPHSSLFTS
jgi:hypothetical protein